MMQQQRNADMPVRTHSTPALLRCILVCRLISSLSLSLSMCGIAFTLATTVRQRAVSAAMIAADSTHSVAVAAVAHRWSRVAERWLQPRGPDVQTTLKLELSNAPHIAACLTATVLHLRGAALTPTAQPLVDPQSRNTLC